MWLKPLFARTSKNAKSGLRKWLEVLPQPALSNDCEQRHPALSDFTLHLHLPISADVLHHPPGLFLFAFCK
jgi:hypothetical protein